MINEDCLVLRKGKETILFNFTPKELDIPLPNADKMIVLFNEIEQQLRVTSHGVVIAPMNCLLMELAD